MAAVLVLNTPDDGRLRPKHVEWPCRNKTCTVLHQVVVSFDLYYDVRKHKIKTLFQPPNLATRRFANPVAASNKHESSVIRRCNQCIRRWLLTPHALTFDVLPRLMDVFKPFNPWVAYWYTIILHARLGCRRSCRPIAANSVQLKAYWLLTVYQVGWDESNGFTDMKCISSLSLSPWTAARSTWSPNIILFHLPIQRANVKNVSFSSVITENVNTK